MDLMQELLYKLEAPKFINQYQSLSDHAKTCVPFDEHLEALCTNFATKEVYMNT